MKYNLVWKKLTESGLRSLMEQTVGTSLVNRMLSLEEMFLFLTEKKYSSVKLKEKAISFKTWNMFVFNVFTNMMYLHRDFLDTGFLNCRVGTNNPTCQEIAGVLPVDVFILF